MFKDIMELLSFVAIIIGMPVAIYQYIRTTRKEQLDREYGTYNALDEKYLEFLGICLKYPRLDIFDIEDREKIKLTEMQAKEELIILTMLFCIFERAFLMYYNQSSKLRANQWIGWNRYIEEYCRRGNFRNAWKKSGATYDLEFEKYMNNTMEKYAGNSY